MLRSACKKVKWYEYAKMCGEEFNHREEDSMTALNCNELTVKSL